MPHKSAHTLLLLNCLTAFGGLVLGVAPLGVQAADTQASPDFKTAQRIAPKVKSAYCGDRPFYRVTVLRNASGEIGGYVLQPAIRDSAIPYLDAEGGTLTAFHIFASDVEKRDAMAIINPLRVRFPIEGPLDCAAE